MQHFMWSAVAHANLTPTLPGDCVEQDAQGRVFMWDRAGNIYYDTEDPRTGVYIVSG